MGPLTNENGDRMNIVRIAEPEHFRVVLIHPKTRNVLVSGEPDAFALPAIDIPPYSRHAETIVDAITRAFGIETYCLFSVPPVSRVSHQYAFVCTTLPNAPTLPGFRWISAASISTQTFSDAQDYFAYSSGSEDVHQCELNPKSGYFARPGWLREILEWAQGQLNPLKMQLTGAFSHLNASSTFCLMRLITEQSAVWFKAVDQANVPELSITRYLTQHFPAYVPRIIAEHHECNGWLSEETSGSHPDATSTDETWIAVADSLADLQIASIGQSLHLLDAGCRDVRSALLSDLISPFFEAMADLMENQETTSPAALTLKELTALQCLLLEALSATEGLDVPNALGQLDFNLGNIIVGHSGRVVFLDWAAACVGNPLFTLEYLLEGLRNLRPSDHALHNEVAFTYMRKWRFLVSPEKLAVALATAPLLACFTYASAEELWRKPSQLRDPARAANLRSLTRRMNREAQAWITRKSTDAFCLQMR
jgi:hypothetical protein